MRIKDLFYAGLAGAFLASPLAQASYKAGYNFSKPEPKAQIKIEASQKPNLEELTKESPKLKSFAEYKHADQYDSLIVKWVNFWNQEYAKHSGYNPLEYNLIKSMIIEESGSPMHKETAFKYDPMQVANQDDPAFPVLKNGSESGLPRNGYVELKKKKATPWKKGKLDYTPLTDEERMTAELSIKYGILWLVHKACRFDDSGKISGFRSWKEALEKYNGGRAIDKNGQLHKVNYAASILARLSEK